MFSIIQTVWVKSWKERYNEFEKPDDPCLPAWFENISVFSMFQWWKILAPVHMVIAHHLSNSFYCLPIRFCIPDCQCVLRFSDLFVYRLQDLLLAILSDFLLSLHEILYRWERVPLCLRGICVYWFHCFKFRVISHD